ncbi:MULTISPECIES: DUF6241 domain-containing protein [Lysinibacillus]|uniref:DUF6241 domain-containing protein n=1 Tax=Lysinibacillus TaxID=400634 RepID=UPI000E207006|nr:DUF6241 domain-containing protein [Lysinibacillus capsici]MCT1540213.1 DUF6241 domain-containing protein [Lysinibacillus capsici]MCT1571282.1 DUF6241 domain-containing protein [Lysinibacillus capsici]MCT1647928.1 DUF6241 domain-containing protein [Lysinibacillus capsici]MCT1726470.1 DUF6241 domain-containing protein [Lysinibacillus capsici]MCT1783574.1 DUF6241 domain-containing protein [Lysinibacillus capsici]
MKRKTKSVISIIVILIIFGGAFGYIKFTEHMNKSTPEEEKTIAGYVEVTSKDGTVLKKENEIYPDDLIEHKMNETIHSMSHQKVEAEIKWGHEQITQEKVDRLLAIAKESNYKYKELYISILERWSKGDFSNAVDDHNSIWEMQGGDEEASGKAIRLLTPSEEQAYIQHNLEYDLY